MHQNLHAMNIRALSQHELRLAYITASDRYWHIVDGRQTKLTALQKSTAYIAAKNELQLVVEELARRRKLDGSF